MSFFAPNGWLAVSIVALLCALVACILLLRSRREGRRQEEDGGDLSDDAMRVLAALDCDMLLVDESGDVVRATPDAYRLGLADHDAICNEDLRAQVIAVRADGVTRRFPLETRDVSEYVFDERTARAYAEKKGSLFAAWRTGAGGSGARDGAFRVTPRPNYLMVTVVRVTGRLVLVMAQDVSERRRFERLRDDFTVHVSERLAEPAARIERLAARIADPDSAGDMRAQAREAEREARYMRHLVSDLTVLLQAQEEVEPTPGNRLDVAALVGDVVASEREKAREAGVGIAVRVPDGPVMVHGDAAQLRAAVGKLVENAVEYTPSGDSASVTVDAAEQGGARCARIRVVDHGAGIPKADQERIFTRFWRGDAAKRLHGGEEGTGLGLSIAKHVALTHHGTLAVWSRPGEGSTFTLVLPLCSGDA